MFAENVMGSQQIDLLDHLIFGQLGIDRLAANMQGARLVLSNHIQRMAVVEPGLGNQYNAPVLPSRQAGDVAIIGIFCRNFVYDQPFDIFQ